MLKEITKVYCYSFLNFAYSNLDIVFRCNKKHRSICNMINIRTVRRLAVALAIVGSLIANTNASVISWEASSGLTPDQVGFTLNDSSNPETPVLTNATLTLSNDSSSERMYYSTKEPETSLLFPAIFEASFRMRYVSGSQNHAGRTPSSVFVATSPNVGSGLCIDKDRIYLVKSWTTPGPSVVVDTDDTFHDYLMRIDGTEVTIFQDGNLVLSGTTINSTEDISANPEVAFGDCTTLESGTSEWKSFSHNAAVAEDNISLTNSLVAYYPFNGNANDESTNSYDGVVREPVLVVDRFDISDMAYSFDGTNDGIDISSLAKLQSFTMCGWIKTDSMDGSHRSFIGFDGMYKIAARDGMVSCYTKAGSSPTASWTGGTTSTVAVADGVWHSVIWSRGLDGYQKLYIDGVLDNEGQFNAGTIPAANFGGFIGMERMWSGTERYFWQGEIDDVRIYNRPLSSAEVEELYALEAPLPVSKDSDGDGMPDVWEEAHRGAIMFQDDFDDGNDDGWEQHRRVWNVIDGQYVSDGEAQPGYNYGSSGLQFSNIICRH